VTQTEALGHTVNIRARIRSASQNKDVVMNRLLSAVLLSCAAASLSNPAWSFGGFGNFEHLMQTIKCVKNPGTDYVVCSPKAPDEEAEPTVETTTETYTEREYGEEQVATTRSEPVEKYRTVNSNTERTTDDENNRWVDTTTTTTTIVYEVTTMKRVVTPWTDTTYEVTITTTTHENGTTETERSKPKVVEVVEGEDLVVSNDTHTYQEEVVEVSVTYEPYPESVANLIPSIEIPDAMSFNPDYDYLWSHIQSWDLSVDLSDTRFQECSLAENLDADGVKFRVINANNDDYPDYVVSMDCKSDIWWEGINTTALGVRQWVEPFIFFMCNSDQGLYNCTEEVTGHENVVNVSSQFPGMLMLNTSVFHDFNNDGVLDAVFIHNNDNSDPESDRLQRIVESGDEEILAGIWNLFGYTWEEALEYCQGKPYVNPDKELTFREKGGCYLESGQNSAAISGPDGKWVIQDLDTLDGPAKTGVSRSEVYFKDGVYHVNSTGIHGSTDFYWWTFNNETNKFEFVAHGSGSDPETARYDEYSVAKLPFNRAENFYQYRVKELKGYTGEDIIPDDATDKSDWTKVDDFEVKIQEEDPTLVFYDPVDDSNGCDFWRNSNNYDKCQLDQIHIIKKDSSGKVSKIMEYRPLDWTEDRKPYPYFRVDHNNKVVEEPHMYATSLMHGFWVNRALTLNYGYKIMQLETRPDAPWYLIVEYLGDYYMRNPGQEPMEGFIKACASFGYNTHVDETGILRAGGIVDFDDKRCAHMPMRIIFKYELDFENNTMEYAGPLLDYPFVGDKFLDETPEHWVSTDINGDGFKDIRIQGEYFVSDDTGRLLWLHKTQDQLPLMPYGRYTEYEKQNFGAQDTHYNQATFGTYGDFNNDGITDYIAQVSGERVQNWLSWAVDHPDITVDQNLLDLYPRGGFFLDIVYGQEDIFTELDTLDAVEMQERFDRCVDIYFNYARWDGENNPGASHINNCYKYDYLDPYGTVPKEPRYKN